MRLSNRTYSKIFTLIFIFFFFENFIFSTRVSAEEKLSVIQHHLTDYREIQGGLSLRDALQSIVGTDYLKGDQG